MLEEQAIQALKELPDVDPERAHSQADNILITFLQANGFVRLAAEYQTQREEIGFWYA